MPCRGSSLKHRLIQSITYPTFGKAYCRLSGCNIQASVLQGSIRRRNFTLEEEGSGAEGKSNRCCRPLPRACSSFWVATSKPEKAWVRTDGPKFWTTQRCSKKGETDIALCNANLDGGAVDEGARKCMGLRGYALVPKDQAEDARAGFAAAQRASTPSARGG